MPRKQASKKLRTRLVIPIIVAPVVNIVNTIGTLHIPGSGETLLFHSYIQHDQIIRYKSCHIILTGYLF